MESHEVNFYQTVLDELSFEHFSYSKRTLFDRSEITRLGKGVDKSGSLADEALPAPPAQRR
jgi:hypothetical protein